MSALEEKTQAQLSTGGKARRTHASLLACRGYRVEMGKDAMVSIQAMDVRTFWRHVGGGKWSSPGAEYEKVEVL